ncbi:MAG TPA: glycoside hydrolase family 20 zincin-like fold domain-containing protein, partial [Chitinispirillaceae bacterium]|nr:glycoside hydrolase family 20 zincin-like fold domain-containing protein [Chitinispirillaceae bacterium]
MDLLPVVKSFSRTSGTFELNLSCTIRCVNNGLRNSALVTHLSTGIYRYTGLQLSANPDVPYRTQIVLKSDNQSDAFEAYTITIDPQKVEIHGTS